MNRETVARVKELRAAIRDARIELANIELADRKPWAADRLVFDSRALLETPVIRGTLITVTDITRCIIDGMTWDNIIRKYPGVTEADIRACLSYALDAES